MQNNLTNGGVLKSIAVFSGPFLLSYFLQTLYGMADLFIAGQFNGADVITAVSIGSQIMHMLTVIIVGLAMGSTVTTARAVGAEDTKGAARAIGNSVILFVMVAAVLTAVLLLSARGTVSLVRTPIESRTQTFRYLLICFAGIPFITAYNVIAAVFRGLGDSKSPLYFIFVACMLNIALDFVFMGPLGMQAEGAALATVIAQGASVAFSFLAVRLRKKKADPEKRMVFSREDFKIDRDVFSRILKIGVPVAVQDGFIQISFMIITVIANKRGLEVAAAVGIVEKIITFLFLVPSAMLATISALAAQNLGAGKTERARKTLLYGMCIAAGIGFTLAMIMQFVAEPVISLFTGDPAVVELGVEYIRTYVFDCFVAGIHFSFSGYFCACGKSFLSFLHNALSIICLRIPGAALASRYFPDTLTPMGLAPALGSLFSAVFCLIAFAVHTKHEKAIKERLRAKLAK